MKKNFGFLIFERAQPIDIMGPWEVFSFWKQVLHGPIDLHLISEKGGFVQLDNGIEIKTHFDFANAPPLDVLLIPGGVGRIQQAKNEKLLDFIRKKSSECQHVISVCTGMFLLYHAGLLEEKKATTYWRAIPELKEMGVEVSEKRIVRQGKIWTSGGVTSGIDIALAFIEEIGGKEVAGQVQLLLEYFPDETLYVTPQTMESLPPYQGAHGIVKPHLPEYIRKVIARQKEDLL